jgi:hypothetical protein
VKLLRNPIVTGLLVLAALAAVFFQVVAPRWHFGSPAQPPAAVATLPPAPEVAVPPSAPRSARPAALSQSNTNLVADQPIDRAYLAAHFDAWVNSPRHDPFLLLAPDPTGNGRDGSETNSPVAGWKLNSIWSQTGSRLAVINQRVYGEGDEVAEGYRILRIQSDEVWFQGPVRKERLGFERRHGNPAPVPATAAPATAAPAVRPSPRS